VATPILVAGALIVVLVGKPLAALLIVWALGYPLRAVLTVAIALSQIGEFSFILAALGRNSACCPRRQPTSSWRRRSRRSC
jgi:CPA2 family monovalent cation:H+ antiporter-2